MKTVLQKLQEEIRACQCPSDLKKTIERMFEVLTEISGVLENIGYALSRAGRSLSAAQYNTTIDGMKHTLLEASKMLELAESFIADAYEEAER